MAQSFGRYSSKSAIANGTTAYISGGDGAESLDCSTALRTLRAIEGHQSIYIRVDFSSSGANVDLGVIFYTVHQGTTTFLGVSEVNVEALAWQGLGSEDTGQVAVEDTLGATHYEIRHKDPSAGSIDVFCWEA